MKVAVVGLGYVGTVTAACLASRQHDVYGVDVDAAKVDEIRSGRSPVAEPGLDALVARVVAERQAAGHDLVRRGPRPGRRVTRLRRDPLDSPRRHGPDLPPAGRGRPGGGAAHGRRRPARRRHSVIIRSTVPPGTVDDVVTPALAGGLAGAPVAAGAGMCPEFLREGSGIADFFASPFLIVGTADPGVGETGLRAVRVPRSAGAGGGRPGGRGAQVRLQRLPRHQGVLRQRGGPDASASWAWTPAR